MTTTFIILLAVSVVFNIILILKAINIKKIYEKKSTKLLDLEKNLKEKEQSIDGIIKEFETKHFKLEQDLQTDFDIRLKQVEDVVRCTHRQGFYKQSNTQTNVVTGIKVNLDVNIFVNEIDRYTNGKSKIELDHIDIIKLSGDTRYYNKKTSMDYIEETFNELVDTNSIEWLESVNEIQKARQKKLDRITSKDDENTKTE